MRNTFVPGSTTTSLRTQNDGRAVKSALMPRSAKSGPGSKGLGSSVIVSFIAVIRTGRSSRSSTVWM